MIGCLQNLEKIDWKNLLIYIRKFDNKTLARRVGYIMDNLENISLPSNVKKNIVKFSGKNIYYFDSTKEGDFEPEWNMVIPKKLQEAIHA